MCFNVCLFGKLQHNFGEGGCKLIRENKNKIQNLCGPFVRQWNLGGLILVICSDYGVPMQPSSMCPVWVTCYQHNLGSINALAYSDLGGLDV